MISAMPAVALRRERGKEQNGTEQPQTTQKKPQQKPGVVDYYNNKISRMSSFPPTRRTYSTSTSLQSPDIESQPFPGEEARSEPCLLFGHISLFHLGCVFLAAGLIMLFVSVGSIKGDVVPIRAAGSSLVVFGALLCLIRTVFFQKPEIINVMGLRSSDSFFSRQSRSPNSPSSPLSPAPTQPLPTHEEEDDDAILCPDEKTQNGGVLTSESNGPTPADRSPMSPTQQETEGLLNPHTVNV